MNPNNSKKLFLVSVIVLVALFALAFWFKAGLSNSQTLWNLSQEGKWLLPLVLVASLVDSINPCAFSVLLLTIAFLFSIGKLRSNILSIGSMYILGVFTVYVLIGLGILQVLHFFSIPHFMARLAAGLLIALGSINLINEIYPKFPIKLKIPNAAHHKMASLMEKASIPTAFFLGAFVGLCEFPCTGGPYLLVLGLLHDQQTYLRGLGYLALYNAVFVLPLVIILFVAGNKVLVDKVQQWQKQEKSSMRYLGGLAMIALGVLIFLL